MSLQGHDESRPYTHVDRAHNVIVFGVPESRDLLGTEALVNRAFEVAVGRKVAVADYRRVGSISAEASKSRLCLLGWLLYGIVGFCWVVSTSSRDSLRPNCV